jgi:hypothetical protein
MQRVHPPHVAPSGIEAYVQARVKSHDAPGTLPEPWRALGFCGEGRAPEPYCGAWYPLAPAAAPRFIGGPDGWDARLAEHRDS